MLSLVAQNSELDSHAWMVNSMPGGVGNQCNKRNENYCTDHSLNHGPAHFIFWNTQNYRRPDISAHVVGETPAVRSCAHTLRLQARNIPSLRKKWITCSQGSIPKTCCRTWLILKKLLILPHVRIFRNSAFIFNSSHTRQPIKKITWINTTSLQWI